MFTYHLEFMLLGTIVSSLLGFTAHVVVQNIKARRLNYCLGKLLQEDFQEQRIDALCGRSRT